VSPELELGAELLDLRREQELVQPTDAVTLGSLEDDVRKRSPAPERERAPPKLNRRVRRSGSRSLEQPLELREVQGVRLDAQPVPG
jgi:hypothetical protein